MLTLSLLLVPVVWCIVIWWKWKKNVFDVIERIPGLKWYPFFGTFVIFTGVSQEDILDKFAEVVVKYGPFYRSWHGTTVPEVHLTKPHHMQIILRSSTHTEKGSFYKLLYPFLGDGLFISERAKWFYQRKLLTPKFHFKILESFLETFAEKATHLTRALESSCGKADGQYFDISPEIYKCTLKIICDVSMGIDLNTITDTPLEFVKNVHKFTEIVMWRYWRPYINDQIFNILPQGRRFKKIVNDAHKFGAKVVAHKKELRQIVKTQVEDTPSTDDGTKLSKQSFLDLILEGSEDQKAISDQDLHYLVNTFVVAGFETTANTVIWALFLLGNHSEVQEKLFEEVREVLKDKDAPSKISDLNEMQYMECVIKETLRLYPPLPFVSRRVTEDINIDGYTVPADTQALMHIFFMHRDPEYWPEPNKFDPERFTPENSKNRHPFSYIPFSAGPRNCIGQRFTMFEEKVLLSSIVKKYRIVSRETPQEKRMFGHVILRPQNGIDVKLQKR